MHSQLLILEGKSFSTVFSVPVSPAFPSADKVGEDIIVWACLSLVSRIQ